MSSGTADFQGQHKRPGILSNSFATILLFGFAAGVIMAALTVLTEPNTRHGSAAINEDAVFPETVVAGSIAPDFESEKLSGGRLRLSDLKGKVIALNFWATWCGPCLVEMPALQSAQEKYLSQGFEVVAVNAGEPKDTVDAFVTSQNLSFLTILDSNLDVVSLYDIRAFPTTIWIKANGVVEAKHLGPLDLGLIDAYIRSLLHGQ